MEQKQSKRRRMTGVVVSDKMQKTAVVKVDRTVLHSKYLKRFTKSEKYKAHNPENMAKTGNIVVIEQCRPLSKHKSWRIIEVK